MRTAFLVSILWLMTTAARADAYADKWVEPSHFVSHWSGTYWEDLWVPERYCAIQIHSEWLGFGWRVWYTYEEGFTRAEWLKLYVRVPDPPTSALRKAINWAHTKLAERFPEPCGN